MRETVDYDRIWESFERKYRSKKLVNLFISLIIIAAGIFSVIYIWTYDGDGLLTFRWMTVDGTIFTVVMTALFVAVNIVEIFKKTELTRRSAYFAKLSSAVAECLILTVVLLSQLPFFEEHMHITRPDMFCMHIMIPLLTAASFSVNDSPIGKLRPLQVLAGTAFVTVYAAVIIPLIPTGVITGDMIPYFFLDFEHMGAIYIACCFLLIYAVGCLWSLGLSELNRRLYWRWFRNIAG